jgi:hypothetical protein
MRYLLSYLLLFVFSEYTFAEEELTYSGTLPVFYINTEGGQDIVSKDNYINASCYVDALGIEGYESLGSETSPVFLQIRGRGNWTWTSFDKKPYRIKFSEKVSILGLTKNKHFVLLAHADDAVGFLKNTVGFELSRLMKMEWTPEQRPVEVVLNGEYIGLYFLTENIRVDKNRVNITEQKDEETNPELITGGWLVEIDNYEDSNHISVDVSGTNLTSLRITYHSPEILSDIQRDYLVSQFNSIINEIYIADKSATGWEELIDIESLVRYYVLSEAIDHIEAFQGSCYIYKDLNEKHWKFGPVWDFGHAFNGFHSKQKYIYDYPAWDHCIIEEIAKFPHFQDYVKKIWREFCLDIYPKMDLFIDDFARQIGVAAKYDAARWPQYGNADEQAAVELVKQRFNEKIQWLSTQWGDYLGIDERIEDKKTKTSNVYDLSGRQLSIVRHHQLLIDNKGKYIQ